MMEGSGTLENQLEATKVCTETGKSHCFFFCASFWRYVPAHCNCC